MENFNHILNWKLLRGSHEFPGPEGGTCINEAAVVAAGFPYRKVNAPRDLPDCFCPVIGMFALLVNDRLDDTHRPALLPYVTRLAGSKDTPDVERQRLGYAVAIVGEILSREPTDGFARAGLKDILRIIPGEHVSNRIVAAERLSNVMRSSGFARHAEYATVAITILDGMLAIGNQAPASDIAQVQARMDAVRAQATEKVPA